ncbi:MAG TPA: hypothetical protein VGS22_06095 [Thermoanaerobaculia bacterium]|jgi:hypothetical protein|nr:hypothetical protein [Thermoanaerobaculia bacterium]
MIRASRTLLLSALAVLALLSVTAPAEAATISIAQARSLPLGTLVTVEGRVTTPSGAFESSFFDKGFGLQDLTAGIFISLPSTDLHVGPFRRARVTGVLADSFGLRILVPAVSSDVHLLGPGLPVIPRWVPTAGVGESTEGRIVRVVGRVSTAPSSDLPFGYKLGVNDGSGEVQIFINTQTGIDPFALSLHQLVAISGFSSQFDTHYEIDPRFPADIITPGH